MLELTPSELREVIVAELAVATGVASAPDVATALHRLFEAKGNDARRDAAVQALKRIGRPAVPALIAALKKKKTRQCAGITLYEITGETFGEDARAWSRWWAKQKE